MTVQAEKDLALSWAQLGIVVDNMVEESDKVTFWMSVPELIPRKAVTDTPSPTGGDLVSGTAMVQAINYMMNVTQPVGKKVVINHTIRIGETWTVEKREQAIKDMTLRIRSAELFGGAGT